MNEQIRHGGQRNDSAVLTFDSEEMYVPEHLRNTENLHDCQREKKRDKKAHLKLVSNVSNCRDKKGSQRREAPTAKVTFPVLKSESRVLHRLLLL